MQPGRDSRFPLRSQGLDYEVQGENLLKNAGECTLREGGGPDGAGGIMGNLVRPFLPSERVRSFAIVTTEPNELCAQLHNRMPVVLAPKAWPAWLGEEPADEAKLKSLLAPYPSDGMIC